MQAKKILVVEDDQVTQKLIADCLRSAGYEVFTAHSSATAIKVAREEDPDLVTLDIELTKDSPEDTWDGISVANWLRRLNEGKAKPILMVISGNQRPDKVIEKAAEVGVYTCLMKPVEKQELLDAVASAFK
jgi:CheY-like chemotaxis protein